MINLYKPWIFRSVIACFLLCVAVEQCNALTNTSPTPAKMAALQQSAKLLFTENRGQVMDANGKPRPDILFTAHSGATQLFLTATGINYQFTKITYPEGYDVKHHTGLQKQAALEKQVQKETYKFSLTLAGANPNPVIRKEAKNTYTENFYTTGCQDGITNVGTYERVVYENVYPHIDWVVYSNGSKLKYDFLVHPGGNPKQIKLKIDDAQSVQITEAGELLMKTTLGEVREQAPVSYVGNERINTVFKKNDDGTVGFDIDVYDGELRIDPSVAWATCYGGSGSDEFYACALDGFGDVYTAGYTSSGGMASSNGYQVANGGDYDALLVKFDANGSRLWATYYGGAGDDEGYGCSLDNSNNVYLAGWSGSPGLGTSGTYQPVLNGVRDAILVKFDTNGLRLWATYYGDGIGGGDIGSACKADRSGNIYLCGATSSGSDIATAGAFDTIYGGISNAFLVKFNSLGARQWGTYYGGDNNTVANSIAIDGASNIYIAGITSSFVGIASTGGYQKYPAGGYDAFLAKFTSEGDRLWGTYFGGENLEGSWSNNLGIDGADNVYLAGTTNSTTGIATIGAFQTTLDTSVDYRNSDAFLAKFNSVGSRLWCTYYGGGGADEGEAVAFDGYGNVLLAGCTSSSNGIATPGSYQSMLKGVLDGYLVNFDTSGSRIWGTYFDTSYCTFYTSTVDADGNIYCAGNTGKSITTAGAYQVTYGGGGDGIVVKFAVPPPITADTVSGGLFCAGDTAMLTFSIAGSFSSDNVFTAQLSNAEGNFISPVDIGTLNGSFSGIIRGVIPENTLTSTHYRIRIVASNPVHVGADNGSNITINNVQQALGNDTTLCGNNRLIQVALNANVPNGAFAMWSTGSNAASIIADTGIYWVTVTDGKCIGSDTINIHAQMCNCTGNIPNAFTPNGDGKNDRFHVVFEQGCPLTEYTCNIYNRWGNIVFSSGDPQTGWDGNYHGHKADVGTYMYEIRFAIGADYQNIQHYKGDVVLIR